VPQRQDDTVKYVNKRKNELITTTNNVVGIGEFIITKGV
jgi:hypothetical protein